LVRLESGSPHRSFRGFRRVVEFVVLLLLATNCNELLGIDPGEPKGSSSGGTNSVEGGMGGTASGSAARGGTREPGGAAGQPQDGGRGGASGAEAGAPTAGVGGDGAGGTAGSAGSSSGPCTTNEECRQRGVDWPHLCLSGECVDITTDECNVVFSVADPVSMRDPIIFGAYTREDPVTLGTEAFFWNVRLAMQEFAEFSPMGGLPIDGASRPILVLVCTNPYTDPNVTPRALDHLIDTVHVPGIFVSYYPDLLLDAVHRAFEDREQDVLFFHRDAPSPGLEDYSDEGRVWHMLSSEAVTIPIYAALVERVEQRVNLDQPRPTRVAVAVDVATDALLGGLRVNGEPLASQLDDTVFLVDPQYKAEVIPELEPDIVLEASSDLSVLAIELAFSSAGTPPPFHVLVRDSAALPLEKMEELFVAFPTLRTRLVGTRVPYFADGADTRANYLLRMAAATPPEIDVGDSERLYDLSYFMFYAAAAAPTDGGPLRGRQLRDGMRRLLQGDRYELGPDDMPRILELLKMDPTATVRLYGTLGEPDFDPETGNRERFGSVWCVDESLSFVYDALVYDPSSQSLSGDFPCFDF
jgi:hypothetical protein